MERRSFSFEGNYVHIFNREDKWFERAVRETLHMQIKQRWRPYITCVLFIKLRFHSEHTEKSEPIHTFTRLAPP